MLQRWEMLEEVFEHEIWIVSLLAMHRVLKTWTTIFAPSVQHQRMLRQYV